jgi:hypothetical protein
MTSSMCYTFLFLRVHVDFWRRCQNFRPFPGFILSSLTNANWRNESDKSDQSCLADDQVTREEVVSFWLSHRRSSWYSCDFICIYSSRNDEWTMPEQSLHSVPAFESQLFRSDWNIVSHSNRSLRRELSASMKDLGKISARTLCEGVICRERWRSKISETRKGFLCLSGCCPNMDMDWHLADSWAMSLLPEFTICLTPWNVIDARWLKILAYLWIYWSQVLFGSIPVE